MPETGARRSRRRPWMIGIAIAVGALGVGGFLGLRFLARREASLAFSAAAVCLTGGPDRASPSEANIRARRLHPDDASLARCRSLVDRLGTSRLVKFHSSRLADAARRVDFGMPGEQPKLELAALFREAEALPWAPPSEIERVPVPAPVSPLLDLNMVEQRGRLTWTAEGRETDDSPLGSMRLVSGRHVALEPDKAGRPLSVLRWTPAPPPKLVPYRESGHAWVRDDKGAKVDLGESKVVPLLVHSLALWAEGSRLHARAVSDFNALGADRVLDLPGEIASSHMQSCRTPHGAVIAVETRSEGSSPVSVFYAHDGAVDAWGRIERRAAAPGGELGSWSLGCDDSGARIAWAASEPAGMQPRRPSERDLPLDGDQRIFLATCASGGCSTRESLLPLATGAHSLGGYSSPWVLTAARVFDLGARVLLTWQGTHALHYRLAALDELQSTPDGWLAEVSRPSTSEEPDPRTLVWPELSVAMRGGVAVLIVVEGRHGSSFVIRCESSCEAIDIPPRDGSSP